jgi:hypothetical protein
MGRFMKQERILKETVTAYLKVITKGLDEIHIMATGLKSEIITE